MSTGGGVLSAVRFQYRRLFFWLLVIVAAILVGAALQFGLPDQVVALGEAIPETGDPPWCNGAACR